MRRFLFVVIAVLFSLTTHAADKMAPAATERSEDPANDTFLDRTATRCVSVGVEEATGKIVAPRQLAAITLQLRELRPVGGSSRRVSIDRTQADAGDHQQFRFPYILSMAQYLSVYGVCSHGEKGEGTTPLAESDSKELRVALESSVYPTEEKKNELSAMVLGKRKKFALLEKIFPVVVPHTNIDRGERTDHLKNFRLLDYADQVAEAQKGTDYAVKEFKVSEFSQCAKDMQDYQRKGSYSHNGKSVSARQICEGIMSACGYKDSMKACLKYPESAAAGAGNTPATKTKTTN